MDVSLAGLHPVDLIVILVSLAAVTWMAHALSGAVSSRSGLFQADGTLPWWAVSASIIATLVSAVTFVSVPANVFAEGGDLKYAQVILGLALGKVAVGLMLARPFYKSGNLTTSYAYIGARLDPATGELSMYLGLALTLINAGVKLLTASLVLDVITGWGIPGCALAVISIGVLWTMLAGIKTVIWTDFLLFVVFTVGAVFALVFISLRIDMSLLDALRWLDERSKLVWLDIALDPDKRYTLWAAVIGGIALNIATGSTQGTWQRVKACRSARDAVRAFNMAAWFYGLHFIILAVGLGLAVFYGEAGIDPGLAAELAIANDRVFPYFILNEIPIGLSGLFIAAIFAAAISTLDSALAEASDLSMSHFYARLKPGQTERHYVAAARLSMILWGGIFLGMTLLFARFEGESLLDLTFLLPNYVYGALFGSIVLARIGVGRLRSVLPGFAVAIGLTIYLSQTGIAFFFWCPIAGVAMVAVVWLIERTPPEWSGVVRG